jgi:hypothetical protein
LTHNSLSYIILLYAFASVPKLRSQHQEEKVGAALLVDVSEMRIARRAGWGTKQAPETASIQTRATAPCWAT